MCILQKDESMKGYGGVGNVKHVWEKVPVKVKTVIANSCFGHLLEVALSIGENKRAITRGLMELFWDTTNTFHMPAREMTVTPLDFAMLSGVPFGGMDVVYNRKFREETKILTEMYGGLVCKFPVDGVRNINYSLFSGVFDDESLVASLSDDQLARVFITYLLSTTIFADKSNKTWFHYLPCLRDLSKLEEYDWGAAGYANFLGNLRRSCRVHDTSNYEKFTQANMGGFWNILEFWFYEYFPTVSSGSTKKHFPAICRWAKAYHQPSEHNERPRLTDLNSFRDFMNSDAIESVCSLPWVHPSWDGIQIPGAIRVASDLVKQRVLFKGPFGYVWYLGERVTGQYISNMLVPMDPPGSMFQLDSLPPSNIAQLREEKMPYDSLVVLSADYEAFHQARLAPAIKRCEVRTRVPLPEARVLVRGPNGETMYEEIPESSDPVEGLPFPPDFKGFDRVESEKLWRLLHTSMKRVGELRSFINIWASIPKVQPFMSSRPQEPSNGEHEQVLVGQPPTSSVQATIQSRINEQERIYSLKSGSRHDSHKGQTSRHINTYKKPSSRKRSRRQIDTTETESDADGVGDDEA
ncbi:hypothetical protein vseg_004851 [Gypsophila vaccaria]